MMNWSISRFKAGDWVEVLRKDEILATLDKSGGVGGMPFMPEMLRYCGQRFRVAAVAHKTCDPTRKPWARRLNSAVHLEGLRCDGSAHDGCQAECNLFWKDKWLRPVDSKLIKISSVVHVGKGNSFSESYSEIDLCGNTRANEGKAKTIYSCQATQLFAATKPLPWWDVRQYLFDILTGNHKAGRVFRVLFLASLRWSLARVPVGYRIFRCFHDWAHWRLTGRKSPSLNGQVADGKRTPTGTLGLVPDEVVRIKKQSEIELTVDKHGKNRGLTFDPEEMAPYCGRVVRVHKTVTKIIDEGTGRMLHMKEPCIMLKDVFCKADYAMYRLNCPRAIPSYWRELWLERVTADEFARDRNATTDSAVGVGR